MTRLAILSDIHANLLAVEAVLNDIKQFEVQHIIIAGDIINCGAYSVQVLERLTKTGCTMIRGNHEFYLLDYQTPREPGHWQSYALPRWLNKIIPMRWKNYLAALPDTLTLYYPDAPPVRILHGLPGNPWRGIYPTTPDDELAAALKNIPDSTVIVGHTHLPLERHVNGWHVINAGSVGLPLDGIPSTATYVLLESHAGGWNAEFRRVSYDISPMFEEFERIDFVGETGATGMMYIEEFKTARLRIAPFNLWLRETGQQATLKLAAEFLSLGERIWKYIPPAYQLNR